MSFFYIFPIDNKVVCTSWRYFIVWIHISVCCEHPVVLRAERTSWTAALPQCSYQSSSISQKTDERTNRNNLMNMYFIIYNSHFKIEIGPELHDLTFRTDWREVCVCICIYIYKCIYVCANRILITFSNINRKMMSSN